MIESSLTAFTGFAFALVFICTLSECVTLRWPTTVTANGKSKSLTAKAFRSRKTALNGYFLPAEYFRYCDHYSVFQISLRNRGVLSLALGDIM